jgi:hypothetical protein
MSRTALYVSSVGLINIGSDDEKKAVIAKAVGIAGSADKVTDQVSIKQ